jgi:hypothetical protein
MHTLNPLLRAFFHLFQARINAVNVRINCMNARINFVEILLSFIDFELGVNYDLMISLIHLKIYLQLHYETLV